MAAVSCGQCFLPRGNGHKKRSLTIRSTWRAPLRPISGLGQPRDRLRVQSPGPHVAVTLDSDGDGLPDTQLEYEYDDSGIRVAQTKTVDGDGDGDFDDAEDTSERTDCLVDHHNHTGYAQTIEETVLDPDTETVISKRVYTLGHDEIAQTDYTYDGQGNVTDETTHTFLHDGHGSVRALLDAAAAIAQVRRVGCVKRTIWNKLRVQARFYVLILEEYLPSSPRHAAAGPVGCCGVGSQLTARASARGPRRTCARALW